MAERINLRRFFRASSGAFAVRVFAAAIAFLMNVVVTRVLGAHEAGLFFLGQTFLIILAMLSRFGLDHLIVRFIAIATDQNKPAVANAVLLRAALIALPLSTLTTWLCFAFADTIAGGILNQQDFAPTLRASALCIVPFTMFQVLSFGLQGRSQVSLSIVVNTAIFPAFILCAAKWCDAWGTDSSYELSVAAIVSAALTTSIALVFWLRRSSMSIDFGGDNGKKLAASAFPMFWISVILLANAWLPQLVLAGYGNPEEIAMLNNAKKTAMLLGFLLLAINSAASPMFAAMYERNEHGALREFADRVNGIVLMVTIPLMLTVLVFAGQILSIFGPQFAQAAWILRVLVIGQFINAATGSVGYLLIMSGHERNFRNATALSAIVGGILCIWLIPAYGTTGAAVATAGVLAISSILAAIQAYLRLGINVLKPDIQYPLKAVLRRCCS